jgi:hypothetical protein
LSVFNTIFFCFLHHNPTMPVATLWDILVGHSKGVGCGIGEEKSQQVAKRKTLSSAPRTLPPDFL